MFQLAILRRKRHGTIGRSACLRCSALRHQEIPLSVNCSAPVIARPSGGAHTGDVHTSAPLPVKPVRADDRSADTRPYISSSLKIAARSPSSASRRRAMRRSALGRTLPFSYCEIIFRGHPIRRPNSVWVMPIRRRIARIARARDRPGRSRGRLPRLLMACYAPFYLPTDRVIR